MAEAEEEMDDETTRLIRESYDRIADEYASRIFHELQHKPLDRELLTRFAREVGGGPICDIGCGPGHVTRYLRDLGASVFGLDLSPQMIRLARKLNPHISFREGDMMALSLPNGAVAGIVAFYAIVNIPERFLASVFREMKRVLQPDGRLFLAFHVGNETIHREELWSIPISMDFFLFLPQTIRSCLEEQGLVVDEVVERGPYAPDVEYQSQRAYIFARNAG